MNNIVSILFVIILVGCFASCNTEDCQNFDYGDQYLDPISLTFESGAYTNAFIYKDSTGLEHRYELSSDLFLHDTHLHPDTCEGNLIFIAHDPDHYLRSFSNQNNTRLAYVQIVDFLDGEQNLMESRLTDITKLSVYDDNSPPDVLGRICIMTSSRGGSLNTADYNSAQFIEHDSLVLMNKKFYNVLEQMQGIGKLYYTRTEGIVSFTDNTGVQLIFDRAE
jgi:hypothetical protein